MYIFVIYSNVIRVNYLFIFIFYFFCFIQRKREIRKKSLESSNLMFFVFLRTPKEWKMDTMPRHNLTGNKSNWTLTVFHRVYYELYIVRDYIPRYWYIYIVMCTSIFRIHNLINNPYMYSLSVLYK